MGFIWVYMGVNGFIWIYMGFIWVYMVYMGFILGLYGFIWIYIIYLYVPLRRRRHRFMMIYVSCRAQSEHQIPKLPSSEGKPVTADGRLPNEMQRSSFIDPGIPTTIETMDVNITTIAYLRALIIEIGSTIILMVVEAQGDIYKHIIHSANMWVFPKMVVPNNHRFSY